MLDMDVMKKKPDRLYFYIKRLPVWLALGMIKIYRKFISPVKPPTCRFYPSCSQYAAEALDKYGIIKGTGLAMIRVLKCNPFHPGGHDPVK